MSLFYYLLGVGSTVLAQHIYSNHHQCFMKCPVALHLKEKCCKSSHEQLVDERTEDCDCSSPCNCGEKPKKD